LRRISSRITKLFQATLSKCGEKNLPEKRFGLLQIKADTSLGFFEQFKAQHSLRDNAFFYVEGCGRCSFTFRIEATRLAVQEAW